MKKTILTIALLTSMMSFSQKSINVKTEEGYELQIKTGKWDDKQGIVEAKIYDANYCINGRTFLVLYLENNKKIVLRNLNKKDCGCSMEMSFFTTAKEQRKLENNGVVRIQVLNNYQFTATLAKEVNLF
jgi:hypothetical protein